jgi:uncharacterized protein
MTGRVDKLVAKFDGIKAGIHAKPAAAAHPTNGSVKRSVPVRERAANGGPSRGGMPKGHRRILAVLAHYGATDRTALALRSRYGTSGGGFTNYLSALRATGQIESWGPIAITDAGLTALAKNGGGDFLPLDGDALFEDWMAHPALGKAHRAILRALRANKGRANKEELARMCDPPYEPNGGGFANALSKLRTLGLVEGKGEIVLLEPLR